MITSQDIVKKYPKIFSQRKYVGCGEGWYWLIDRLCDTIQHYIDDNKVCQVEVTDIKEKFGGLRFYFSGGDDYVRGMVWLAEHLSYQICERCGSSKDIVHTKGWIKTLCSNCYKKGS